jgi:Fur family transcriptional regulator, ferric uptake regulator
MNSITKFKTLIRKTGLRSTPPRIAVLQALSKIATPLSHGDLIDKLAPQGLDRATIFRNLSDLTEAGLLSRIDVGDHTWRFELKNQENKNTAHPHFVCTDCGDVSCLPTANVQVSHYPSAGNNKVGNISEILLKGHCEDCEE